VRGVLRRAQGPCDRAVRSPVRVRGVCGAADQDENPVVSRVPRAHRADHEGVLLLATACVHGAWLPLSRFSQRPRQVEQHSRVECTEPPVPPPVAVSCAPCVTVHTHTQSSTVPLQAGCCVLRVERWFGATPSHQPSLRATSVVYDVRRPTHDGAGAGVTQRHRYAARWGGSGQPRRRSLLAQRGGQHTHSEHS
jgi:hypothetical protein